MKDAERHRPSTAFLPLSVSTPALSPSSAQFQATSLGSDAPPPSRVFDVTSGDEPSDSKSKGFSALHLRLCLVVAGLLCLGLSYVSPWIRPAQDEVYSLWAMIGLGLASLPVLYDSLTSLRSDGFEATKYYMDQFVALAILACFATGQYATGTLVATILIVGQILEEHTTLGVEEAVHSLLRLSRVKARRLTSLDTRGQPVASGMNETLVEASALRTGDRVRVLPGETIPADGQISSGITTLDQASITGESLPVDAQPGSAVFAGTLNLTASIEMTVGKIGEETVIGRVTSIVEEAKTSRAPVMRLIDEYTRYYMPLVLIVTGFVLFFTRDVQRAISVIIVAMPCAFVLASPSAMVAALAVASRLGVLVKSSRFFEVAQQIDTVVFDKTGTLTTGQLKVTSNTPAPGVSTETLLETAASLEAHSTHPIARAIIAEARSQGLTWPESNNVMEVPGRGVRDAGVIAGRRSWLIENGIHIPDTHRDDSATSTLYVAREGHFLGSIQLADSLRSETRETAESLRRLGIEDFVMLTGDRPEVAAKIAREAGLTRYRAECLPEEKLAEVAALKEAGNRVLVIGDGVNDAPALAAGNLGVAMGALGSDVAIKTADVALMGHDLRALPRFLALSDRTLKIINQNLIWGLFFIALFVTLSAFGLISPILAAFLHEFSAFFVIFNSARLLRFDEQADPAKG